MRLPFFLFLFTYFFTFSQQDSLKIKIVQEFIHQPRNESKDSLWILNAEQHFNKNGKLKSDVQYCFLNCNKPYKEDYFYTKTLHHWDEFGQLIQSNYFSDGDTTPYQSVNYTSVHNSKNQLITKIIDLQSFIYDSIINHSREVEVYEYNAKGLLSKVLLKGESSHFFLDNLVTEYSYNRKDSLTKMTQISPLGDTTILLYAYNRKGKCIGIERKSISYRAPTIIKESFAYDKRGNCILKIWCFNDGRCYEKNNLFNAKNLLVKTTTRDLKTNFTSSTEYIYNESGFIIEQHEFSNSMLSYIIRKYYQYY